MNIRILGAHNCESENTRLSGILIDDKIAVDAGSLSSSVSLDIQENLTAVLLTHHHYDHIRDIMSVGMNNYLADTKVKVYSIQSVYEVLNYLFDSNFYHDFMKRPQDNPAINFTIIEPHRSFKIEDYEIVAIPVKHSVPAVGFRIMSGSGKELFFTGDTGPEVRECWEQVNPDLLIIECTASDRFYEFGKRAGHMTTGLLKEVLTEFKELKGYIPQVITVHMSPRLEEEIRTELAAVSDELEAPIQLGYEGMEVRL